MSIISLLWQVSLQPLDSQVLLWLLESKFGLLACLDGVRFICPGKKRQHIDLENSGQEVQPGAAKGNDGDGDDDGDGDGAKGKI